MAVIERIVGFLIKQMMKDEDVYKNRESQINAIEKTFECASRPIMKHHSKPGVTPLEILPCFLDFMLWKHTFAQVIFDSDPAPKGRSLHAQMKEMSQGMIRVRLSKRRKIGARNQVAQSRLVVKHRELNDKEIAAQDDWIEVSEDRKEHRCQVPGRLSKREEIFAASTGSQESV